MVREGEKETGGGGGGGADEKGKGGKIQGSTNHSIIFAPDRPIYFRHLFASSTYTLYHMYPYQLLVGFTKKKRKIVLGGKCDTIVLNNGNLLTFNSIIF